MADVAHMPVLAAVGFGDRKPVTIPIAGLASAGNLWAGQLDIGLGTLLGLGVAVGTALGARIAQPCQAVFSRGSSHACCCFIGALLVVRAA